MAKFIRYEALWELLFKQTFFYHKVHGEQVKWWCFWGLWGTSEILHYSTLRSEWHGSVFYSRLGICFSGRIIFETQSFFIIPMFLRKQSGNSLANWWSVCFKRIYLWCGFDRLSHRVWKLFLCSATKYENYFYALLFYFLNAKVFIIELLFKWAKLAKFIRYEALWELLFKQTFFYHKVHGDVVKW